MRLPQLMPVVGALILASIAVLTGASPATAERPLSYVALGDSYSSGVGAGSYDPASGICQRSTKAYPALWTAANYPSSFNFMACSGAVTNDVIKKQLGPLSKATALVSISIGGNDAGFADAMTTCVLLPDSTCLSRIEVARNFIDKELPAKLDRTYSAIQTRAPNAHVVVVGYPRLYKLGGSCSVGLSETKRRAINGASDELSMVLAKRAANAGFTYADVSGAFAGHEICSGTPWLHSLTIPVTSSYHPTATGQVRGYLPAFSAAAS